jgi:hypothetical protein
MFTRIRVARVQKVVTDVISEWEPLLAFLHTRRVLLGILQPETTQSFIHRVQTAHVWTQGLTEDDFIDQVNDNSDLVIRVEQQLSLLRRILRDLTDIRNAVAPDEQQLTLLVLAVYRVLFPADKNNQFALSNADAMYQTLRSTRLSISQEFVLAPWPVVRPDPSQTSYDVGE